MVHYGYADLHMHTQASDGVATVREVLDYVEHHTNLNVIAITDHDRVDAALWAYEQSRYYSFDVIPGVEVTSDAGHVLGLWVRRSVPTGMSLHDTVQAIHEQGGLAFLAHPYHIHMGLIARNAMKYTRNPQLLIECGLDGLEVHNAGILIPGANLLARALACKLGLTAIGGSDSHTLGAIGHGVTRFRGTCAADLRFALENGLTLVEGDAWPLADYWNYTLNSHHNTSGEFVVDGAAHQQANPTP